MDFYCLSNSQLIANSLKLFNEVIGPNISGGDVLHEFSARVCYHSYQSFLTDDGFLNRVYSRGHVDVFEHGMIQIAIDEVKDLDKLELEIRRKNQYARISRHPTLFDEKNSHHLRVNASFRVWADLASSGIFGEDGLEQIHDILYSFAPKSCMWVAKEFTNKQMTHYLSPEILTYDLSTGGKVTLIARQISHDVNDPQQSSMSIFFDGVSRSLTHQLVRHRRASFSQESQRYVRMYKVNEDYSSPFIRIDGFDDDEFDGTLEQYARLIGEGKAPEDARMVLPNSTRTKIVTTMTMDDWSHFFWLRALDKGAQWEIREAGQAILKLAERHMYPFVKNECREAYQKGFFQNATNPHLVENDKPIERIKKARAIIRREARNVRSV